MNTLTTFPVLHDMVTLWLAQLEKEGKIVDVAVRQKDINDFVRRLMAELNEAEK